MKKNEARDKAGGIFEPSRGRERILAEIENARRMWEHPDTINTINRYKAARFVRNNFSAEAKLSMVWQGDGKRDGLVAILRDCNDDALRIEVRDGIVYADGVPQG